MQMIDENHCLLFTTVLISQHAIVPSFAPIFAFTFCTIPITKEVIIRPSERTFSILRNAVPRSIPKGLSFTDTFCEVEQDVHLVLVYFAEDDDIGWIRLWQ